MWWVRLWVGLGWSLVVEWPRYLVFELPYYYMVTLPYNSVIWTLATAKYYSLYALKGAPPPTPIEKDTAYIQGKNGRPPATTAISVAQSSQPGSLTWKKVQLSPEEELEKTYAVADGYILLISTLLFQSPSSKSSDDQSDGDDGDSMAGKFTFSPVFKSRELHKLLKYKRKHSSGASPSKQQKQKKGGSRHKVQLQQMSQYLNFAHLDLTEGILRLYDDEQRQATTQPRLLNMRDYCVTPSANPILLAQQPDLQLPPARHFARSLPLRLDPRDSNSQHPSYFVYFMTGHHKEQWYYTLARVSLNLPYPSQSSDSESTNLFGDLIQNLPKVYNPNKVHATPDVPILLNVLLARMWASSKSTGKMQEWFRQKIVTKLNKLTQSNTGGNGGKYLSNITVVRVHTGNSAPMFQRFGDVTYSTYGDLEFLADLVYEGGFEAVLEAEFKLDRLKMSLRFSIRVSSVRGTLRLKTNPWPASRIWWGFTQVPDIKLDIKSTASERSTMSGVMDFGVVKDMLRAKILEGVEDALVWPNMEDLCMFGCQEQELHPERLFRGNSMDEQEGDLGNGAETGGLDVPKNGKNHSRSSSRASERSVSSSTSTEEQDQQQQQRTMDLQLHIQEMRRQSTTIDKISAAAEHVPSLQLSPSITRKDMSPSTVRKLLEKSEGGSSTPTRFAVPSSPKVKLFAPLWSSSRPSSQEKSNK